MRVVIAGVPRAGKTTLAKRIARFEDGGVTHTDAYKDLAWSEQAITAAMWHTSKSAGIIEGVTTVRGMRKWMEFNRGKPADTVFWLATPREQLTEGQGRMAKGTTTIMNEILPQLLDRGVRVVSVDSEGQHRGIDRTDLL